ncbi:MAG TPA: acetylxylan esterase, partial [Bryobacteraceae bacterium]|nr:acetylxylan esterase [Bryobacteraceae bacterium]
DRHLQSRIEKAVEADKKEWERVKTLADWERFRDPRLQALRASLGEFPARTPLQTRVIKDVPEQGYRREDLVFQSRPGLWVTANLYLPSKPPNRMPGIVIIHSHHRPRTQAELQDMGILWARAGCAVLVMDQVGHGERIQAYPWNRDAYHARGLTGMQLYLVGESLVKWIVWDVMRGIDFLLERKDIDPERIILLGAVAGGGDPAAVAAALDSRIAAVAPFNFGRRGRDWGAGWGEWESTRCLRRSIVDQFLPWLICASIAPRRLVYSNEMGWDGYNTDRAWLDYQQIFSFYNARDSLEEAHGFGTFPGPGECTNIGPAQRGTLYPELKRWFGIPIPTEEPDDRRPEVELAALNPSVASQLGMRKIHELAQEIAAAKLNAARAELRKLKPEARREWLQARWAARLGDIEPNRLPEATLHWKKHWADAEVEGITLEVESGILVPLLLLGPATTVNTRLPVVVAVSQGGKERILAERSREIEALLKGGTAVCLPDVRGTGETSPDQRRGLMGEERSAAATELMLGNTLLGARLKDLRTVLAYVRGRRELDPQRVCLWGESLVPVNPPRLLLEETLWWQVGPEIQHQAEPLGGLLALLGALYEDGVRTVTVRQGLSAYLSILESPFAYVPYDIVVPGIFDAGDVEDLAASLAPRPLLLEGLVDGRNRLVPEGTLRTRLAMIYESYRASDAPLLIRSREGTPSLTQWILARL